MHEMGIAEGLVRSIQDKIKQRQDINQVKTVYIRLGKFTGITEESLRFWFENLTQDTKLQGAALAVSLVDGKEIQVDSLEAE